MGGLYEETLLDIFMPDKFKFMAFIILLFVMPIFGFQEVECSDACLEEDCYCGHDVIRFGFFYIFEKDKEFNFVPYHSEILIPLECMFMYVMAVAIARSVIDDE